MSSNWREWVQNPQTTAMTDENKNAFWKELLGDALLEAKEKEFKIRTETANAIAKTPNQTAGRNAALDIIANDKKAYASFSNLVREAILKDFNLTLEIDRTSSSPLYNTDEKINGLKKRFLESYRHALREYAIQTEIFEVASDDVHQNFKQNRKIINDAYAAFDKAVSNAEKKRNEIIDAAEQSVLETRQDLSTAKSTIMKATQAYKAQIEQAKQQCHKALTLEILHPDEFDRSLKNAQADADYRKAYFKYKKFMKDNEEEAEDALQKVEAEETNKLKEIRKRWWAVWIGLKNAKYFSLSCGATMGGALIIIASPLGTAAMIIATIAAVPIVYIVTRADWWMTNRAVPELALELSHPIEFLKKYWEKFKKSPASSIYRLIVTFTVSMVWAGLTYDTTLELTKQLYEKSTISEGVASSIMMGITAVMAGVAAWKLYKSYQKNGKMRGLKTAWAATLFAAVAGLGYWMLGADSVEFQKASVLAITIMMTVFTVPTLYTIFDLYTDRMVKAYKDPIDPDTGEDNEFHPTNVNKAYRSIVEDAKNAPNGPQKFTATYNIIMCVGLFIAMGLSIMLQQMIVGENFSFTETPDYQSKAFWWPMLLSMGIVGAATATIFKAINHYADKADDVKSAPGQINTAMLYKALLVLGGAALIGTYGIVMASEDIMGNVFVKWFNATPGQVPYLNAVFTVGLGFLGAAGFYFGNAIRTIKNLFKTNSDSPDLNDPTGNMRKPNFDESIYKNKSRTGKALYRVCDSVNWYGQHPAKKEMDTTILLNAGANGVQIPIGADSAAEAVTFGFSAISASYGASYGMKNTQQLPEPEVSRQEGTVRALQYMRRQA